VERVNLIDPLTNDSINHNILLHLVAMILVAVILEHFFCTSLLMQAGNLFGPLVINMPPMFDLQFIVCAQHCPIVSFV
jgi:hypothetical protein